MGWGEQEPTTARQLVAALGRAHAVHVALVLAGFWGLMMVGVIDRSPTFEEPVHALAGVSAWQLHDFRMNPEDGILAQRLAGLALAGVHPVDANHPSFRATDAGQAARRLFDQAALAPHAPALLVARMTMSLLALGFALTIYAISRSLYGHGGGMLSLLLCALCPTVIGHGPLLTSDMAVALFLLLASWSAWAAQRHPTLARLLASGAFIGCALTAKMSGALVLPIVAAMAVLAACAPAATDLEALRTRGYRVRKALGVLMLQLALAALVVWAFFDFRYAAVSGAIHDASLLRVPWEALAQGKVAWLVAWARRARLLPEAFLYAVALQAGTGSAMHVAPAFMLGQVSRVGWLGYAPYAFLIKTPLPTLLALAAAAVAGLARLRERHLRWSALVATAPLWVLLLVYADAAVASRLGSGARLLLPLQGPMLVFAGALWSSRPGHVSKRWARIAAAGCLGLLVADVGAASPDYLAYFNQVAGGPRRAWQHMVDSSLDWGQDLPALARAVARTQGNVYVSYYGSLGPRRYGVGSVLLPSYLGVDRQPACLLEPQYPDESPEDTVARAAAAWPDHQAADWLSRGDQRLLVLFKRRAALDLAAGAYFISATMMQPLYYPAGIDSGPSHERYAQLSAELAPALPKQGKPDLASLLERYAPEALSARVLELEWLRFARLTAYLRGRVPDGDVNRSILVYYLTDAQIGRALGAPRP